MRARVYILYSPSIDKFYIGSTELEPTQRLQLHVDNFYGNSKYTAKTDDWQIFFTHECVNISQAKAIEQHIKKMKSRVYLKNLKNYPEMISKLLVQYSDSP